MKRLLVIGHVWPEPTTTAAGHRMLQLLQWFLDEGTHITFASTASKTSYSFNLNALNIEEATIHLNDSGFDAFIKKLDPHLVLFDRFMVEEQFGWRVAEHCPMAVRILNTEDLHSLREYREKCFQANKIFQEEAWLQEEKTKREIASIFRSDCSLLVSEFECTLLQKAIPGIEALLFHLPLVQKDSLKLEALQIPSFNESSHFISYGNGKHSPNVAAFKILCQDIWPKIVAQLPQAQLHIYGAYLPQQIQELHAPKKGIYIQGWAAALDEVIAKAKLVLAPLPFGAGIKGKLLNAMEQGTPSITTPTGAEGMMSQENWPGAIASSPEEFAQQAVALYTNQDQWEKAQKRGVLLLNEKYLASYWKVPFFNTIDRLQKTLMRHRGRNIVGSLLQEQSRAATKYMAKWIEAKNKPST